MKIVVTGASGLIGSALVPALRADGHEVVRLVRRPPQAADEARWDPKAGTVDADGLAGVEAAVHLAGAGIGDRRWTESYKRELRESRTTGTATLSKALAALTPRPKVLLSASAIGWYGDTGVRAVDETAEPGSGFVPEMAQAWEAATAPAEQAGLRVVHLRSGLVVSARGGAWGRRLLPIFNLGLGGRLGSGQQYWSFVSLADEVRAIRFLLAADGIRGPVNITAPYPVTNAEMTRTMGQVMHRPAVLWVPAAAIRLGLGEMAADVLGSIRVLPRRLLDAGFAFRHERFADALRAARAGDSGNDSGKDKR
jgi:uncharacterized protein